MNNVIIFKGKWSFAACLMWMGFLGLSVSGLAQKAELHIENSSSRTLAVKVMQKAGATGDTLYSLVKVLPYGQSVEYFAQTGDFYLKTQADLDGKDPVFTKGNPFRVYVGSDGYSVLTVTYTIEESYVQNPMDGRQITKAEFDLN